MYIIYSSQNRFLLEEINAIYVLITNCVSVDSKEMGRNFFTSVQQMFSNLNRQYDTYVVIPVGIVKKLMDFFLRHSTKITKCFCYALYINPYLKRPTLLCL